MLALKNLLVSYNKKALPLDFYRHCIDSILRHFSKRSFQTFWLILLLIVFYFIARTIFQTFLSESNYTPIRQKKLNFEQFIEDYRNYAILTYIQ